MSSTYIKLVLRFFSIWPLPIIHFVASIIGLLFYHLPNDLRRISAINIKLCFPELNEQEHQSLLKRSLIETAKSGLELAPMLLWNKQRCLPLIKNVQGLNLLEEAFEKGNGVIVAIPHLGMWEMVGLYCSANYPMTSLFRPSRIKNMDDFIRNGRERFGAQLAPTDASGIRALYKALSRGEVTAILPDQDPRWGNGEFVPFFGIQAYSMTLLTRLAKKSGATVLFSYAERLRHGKGYTLHFREASDDCKDADSNIATACIASGIEDCIRETPEQYQWSYKRFRTRPEGEENYY